MAKFLDPDESKRLANYWKRQAYDSAVKALSGDQGISIETIRIKTMNEVLQMLGYDAKFHEDSRKMYDEGLRLYNEGYRRKEGRLIKEVKTVVQEI